MIAIVSPAKTLDYESPHLTVDPTMPRFIPEATMIVEKLKKMSPRKISELMNVSPSLGSLNSDRFKVWQPAFTADNSRPAIFAFKGDVYMGLDAASLSLQELNYAQDNLRVLSGLYGLLRPFDRMQPYRLEMGTKLPVRRKKNLYKFWDTKITDALNADLAERDSSIVVNLASNEYFAAVDTKSLDATVVTPVFKDWKNDRYKVISFFAKKARGAMARYLIQNQIENIDGIKAFCEDGYAFDPTSSTETTLVFLRKT